MVIPIVKKCARKESVCNVPEKVTYSYTCELGRLGGEAFESFTEGAERVRFNAFVEFCFDDSLENRDEIYSVSVSTDKIKVGFRDARGAINGAATVALLLRKKEIECCEITDYPSCGFRSLMLDLARGLPRVEDIKNTVRYMALGKYNRLHLHLMDSHGLCYRSDALPEFKFVPYADKPANNYGQYEKDVLRDIAALCRKYEIDVIPEIEIPAHGDALNKAHPEFMCDVESAHTWAICPGNDNIWDFFGKLVGEIVEIFPDCEYVHIGSDELEFADLPEGKKRLCHWDECPRCAALREREGLADRQAEFYYLIEKIHGIVTSHGKKMIMWNEQIDVSKEVPLSRDIILQFWRIAHPGRGPYEGCSFNAFLEKGFKLINSYFPYTYFDLGSYMAPEKMKSWTPFNTPEQSPEYGGQILGGEACAWEYGNYEEYPFYGYTMPPSVALFGDKLWGLGEREYDEEYKSALSEFVFGSEELAEIFDFVGDLVPPREKGRYTFADVEQLNREKLLELIDMLKTNRSSSASDAYVRLAEKILEEKLQEGTILIQINFDKIQGKIKPMHAVGQPPFTSGFTSLDFSPMQILKDANIPYSRLHDVGGAFGSNRYVDIPNIFRDFDADENDPASYDFAFTDELIKGLVEYGVEPYFRLGVTIENQCHIKSYRIHPPKDYAKWARICEHIVRHYNEGWADGYHFGITYWEIWNEADNREDPKINQMWKGTAEQYYELYDVAAKHLKKCFGDKIKVGGYAACGFYNVFADPEKYGLSVEKRVGERYTRPREVYRLNFFLGFLEYISKHGSPIDYFSWHTYGGVDVVTVAADFVEMMLNKYGYGGLETHLNEWNLSHDRNVNNGTSYASANVMAYMIAMQHKKTDMLMYYDARYVSVSAYGGFYDVSTFKPSCVYYCFKAFGELYALGNEVECSCDIDGVYALAAQNGEKKAVILSNIKDDVKIETELSKGFYVYIIDQDNFITKTELNPSEFTLRKNTVAVIKNF